MGGIKDMGGTPDLIFVIDTNKEAIAIQEAKRLKIPVVAVLDSNCNPDDVDHPIPGNDDASRSINLYCDLIAKAALDGIARQQGSMGVDMGAAENPVEAALEETAAPSAKEEAPVEAAPAEAAPAEVAPVAAAPVVAAPEPIKAEPAPEPVKAEPAPKPAKAKAKAEEPAAEEGALFTAPEGEPDDLKKISGVGPVLEKKLHELGITKFAQVAAFSAKDIENVDGRLNFKGRIERDNWLAQAKELDA